MEYFVCMKSHESWTKMKNPQKMSKKYLTRVNKITFKTDDYGWEIDVQKCKKKRHASHNERLCKRKNGQHKKRGKKF